MSQQSLAEMLGISFQQIQKYEKGLNRVTAGRIRQICEALQVPFERIVGRAEYGGSIDNNALDDIQRFLATKEGLGLMKAFNTIKNGRVKRELIELIRAMAAAEKSYEDDAPRKGGAKARKTRATGKASG